MRGCSSRTDRLLSLFRSLSRGALTSADRLFRFCRHDDLNYFFDDFRPPFLVAFLLLFLLLFLPAFLPPFLDALWLSFFPRPEPLFLPPPDSLFTVAHARALASLLETPRSS